MSLRVRLQQVLRSVCPRKTNRANRIIERRWLPRRSPELLRCLALGLRTTSRFDRRVSRAPPDRSIGCGFFSGTDQTDYLPLTEFVISGDGSAYAVGGAP